MKRLRMGTPFWLVRRGAAALPLPAFRGHTTADVAIVGGG
jgi:hypothetical protein